MEVKKPVKAAFELQVFPASVVFKIAPLELIINPVESETKQPSTKLAVTPELITCHCEKAVLAFKKSNRTKNTLRIFLGIIKSNKNCSDFFM